MAPKRASS
jgi:hypothetical protein